MFQVKRVLIILLALISVALKVVWVSAPPATSSLVLDQVAGVFERQGYHEARRYNLTKDKTYQVSVYHSVACPAALTVVPILRNAEVMGLIEGSPNNPVFLVGGTVYDDFPTFQLWFHKGLQRIGVQAHTLPPLVIFPKQGCSVDLLRDLSRLSA